MSGSEESSKLWWVLGILLILIGVFYIASTSSFGGRGIFPYFGAKYQAPVPVTPVSGGADGGSSGGWGFPDLSPLLWLLLLPLLYGLFRGGKFLWGHRGAIRSRIPGVATGHGITLEIFAAPSQININEHSAISARLLKNGRPMWKVPWRKIKFEIVSSPGGVFLRKGSVSVSRPGELLETEIDSDKFARVTLHSANETGTAQVKASWHSMFHGHGGAIFSPPVDVIIGPAPGIPPGVGRNLSFEADRRSLEALNDKAVLTATLMDDAGNPVARELLHFYIHSFTDDKGVAKPAGAAVTFEISDNVQHTLSKIFGPDVPPLALNTGADGKASITFTAGERGTAVICAMHHGTGLQKFADITIGAPAPHKYAIEIQSIAPIEREDAIVGIPARVTRDDVEVDEVVIFTISDYGNTDAFLVNIDNVREDTFKTGKDALSGFAMAKLKTGKKSGEVTIKAVLERDPNVVDEKTVRIAIRESLYVSFMSPYPHSLADGQVCQVGAVIAGSGVLSGKTLQFTISKREGCSDSSLVYDNDRRESIEEVTNDKGNAVVSLIAGKDTGYLCVTATLIKDGGAEGNVVVFVVPSKEKIVPQRLALPSPQGPGSSGGAPSPLLLGDGSGASAGVEVSLHISTTIPVAEAHKAGHVRTVSVIVSSGSSPLADRKVGFYIEKRRKTDAAFVDDRGKIGDFVTVITGENGVATAFLLAGNESGEVYVRAALLDGTAKFARIGVDLNITERHGFSIIPNGKQTFFLDLASVPADGSYWVVAQLSSSKGADVSDRWIGFLLELGSGAEASFIDGSKRGIRVVTDKNGIAIAGIRLYGRAGKVSVTAIFAEDTTVRRSVIIDMKNVPSLPVPGQLGGLSMDAFASQSKIQRNDFTMVYAQVRFKGEELQKAGNKDDENGLYGITFRMINPVKGSALISPRSEQPESERKTGKVSGSYTKLEGRNRGGFMHVKFSAGSTPGRAVIRAEWSLKKGAKDPDVREDIVIDIL